MKFEYEKHQVCPMVHMMLVHFIYLSKCDLEKTNRGESCCQEEEKVEKEETFEAAGARESNTRRHLSQELRQLAIILAIILSVMALTTTRKTTRSILMN